MLRFRRLRPLGLRLRSSVAYKGRSAVFSIASATAVVPPTVDHKVVLPPTSITSPLHFSDSIGQGRRLVHLRFERRSGHRICSLLRAPDEEGQCPPYGYYRSTPSLCEDDQRTHLRTVRLCRVRGHPPSDDFPGRRASGRPRNCLTPLQIFNTHCQKCHSGIIEFRPPPSCRPNRSPELLSLMQRCVNSLPLLHHGSTLGRPADTSFPISSTRALRNACGRAGSYCSHSTPHLTPWWERRAFGRLRKWLKHKYRTMQRSVRLEIHSPLLPPSSPVLTVAHPPSPGSSSRRSIPSYPVSNPSAQSPPSDSGPASVSRPRRAMDSNTTASTNPSATAGQEAALEHTITTTLGALLIGTFFALVLYGLVLHQAYGYFRTYGADALWLKILVITALVLETVVSVLNMDACYDYLVTNFSNTNLERPAPYSIKLLALFPASVALTVQIFFARRVWTIGKKFRIVVFISILFMFAELGLPLSAVILAFEAKTLADALRFSYLVSARNAAATVTDVLLTSILVYSLHKSRTGIKRTDSMINVLIMYAVNTGVLTSAFNILCLVFGFVFPQSFTYAAVDLVSSRLYASSLLAALNSRKVVSEIGSSFSADGNPFGTVIMRSRAAPTHNDPVVVRSEQWELRSKMRTTVDLQAEEARSHSAAESGYEAGKASMSKDFFARDV